jgi:hypothetical protein
MIKKQTGFDKQALEYWDSFRNNLAKATIVDTTETPSDKRKRIAHLEANPEQWFVYYFPDYAYAAPAPFHIAATKRWLANDKWYEARAWSRELAKSARAMMEDLYLLLTKKSFYKVLVSHSYDQAVKLFMPYMINLDSNQRIIFDYGKQQKLGSWTTGDITTTSGFSIMCFGEGQSPRGIRKESVRPDIIDFDDMDTDEAVRNIDRVNKTWKWIEKGVIPTMSVSGKRRIRFNGNIIAKDCIMVRAMAKAKHAEKINIRDAHGKSTWAKNTEEDIDYVLSEISYGAAQGEYFNEPMDDGDIFKEITYTACPPIHTCDAVLVYSDPSTSNKDKGTASNKCVTVIGRQRNCYYIYKCWLDTASNARFIDWLYASYIYLTLGKVDIKKVYIENNSLQDPFYQQVLLPLIFAQSKVHKCVLPISPDARKKPDKFFRIEGTLEPLHRMGLLKFNLSEKQDPNMQRLEAQMKGVSKTAKLLDGPDTIEGGIHILQNSYADIGSMIHTTKRTTNPRRM